MIMANNFNSPQSRNEAILQNILGADNVIVTPQSRIEALLIQILEEGAMGGKITASYDENTHTVTLSNGGED